MSGCAVRAWMVPIPIASFTNRSCGLHDPGPGLLTRTSSDRTFAPVNVAWRRLRSACVEPSAGVLPTRLRVALCRVVESSTSSSSASRVDVSGSVSVTTLCVDRAVRRRPWRGLIRRTPSSWALSGGVSSSTATRSGLLVDARRALGRCAPIASVAVLPTDRARLVDTSDPPAACGRLRAYSRKDESLEARASPVHSIPMCLIAAQRLEAPRQPHG